MRLLDRHLPSFLPGLKINSSFVSYPIFRQYWRDVLTILILMILGGSLAYVGGKLIDPVILDADTFDTWFHGDIPRVFQNMTDRGSNHNRIKVHPLFSLLAYSPVFFLHQFFNLDQIDAVRIVLSLVAALWLGTLFLLLRLIGCRRFDAILFCGLGISSAATIFWFTVPETYPFGSLSILLALCWVVLSQHRQLLPFGYVIISALTMSFTTTNWMVGLLATKVNHNWQHFWRITINTFCLVTVLWGVQKFIFPTAVFFLGDREEQDYLVRPGPNRLPEVLQSFLSHTMVMPEIKTVLQPGNWIWMTTQLSLPGSGSIWGAIAVAIWLALFSLGVWAIVSLKQQTKLRFVLGLSLIGQLVLHAIYGGETFLYSLHFAPLFIVLVALSTLTKARRVALVLVSLLIVTAGINNSLLFQQATRAYVDYGSQRQMVLAQMRLRPQDFWPRGIGHVVLALPGSKEPDKSYYEPGGSFSPTVGSFGTAIWVADRQGRIQATSDTIPLDRIQQKLVDSPEQPIPQILIQTESYESVWSVVGQTRWQMELKPVPASENKLMPVIRSVGPAGAPIQSLNWDGNRLLVNDRWAVTLSPVPVAVYLGSETSKTWKTEQPTVTEWQSKDGWGYARFELPDSDRWTMTIEDAVTKPELGLSIQGSTLKLNLPDQQFVESLKAQIAHLNMGLVDNQTRPGEPTNYPIPWQRDGVYVVVGLARAGQLDLSRQLSTYFAENDFFGGFGAEADAPGLSIWALTEVANQLRDPQYDQWVWPHIQRKAEFILKMLSTKENLYQPFTSPAVPEVLEDPELSLELSLVAEPAQSGLIMGRMDNHRPLLFVNAVSYRGLLDAATLAQRSGYLQEAEQWRTKAIELKAAWEKAFQPPESDNDRTYISSLWQSWIATDSKEQFLTNLQQRWTAKRDQQGGLKELPLWTYFEVAEAHQWLLLRQPDRVWQTLQWFWQNQASPGLYTWWEGDGEENTFNRWKNIRGWVKPAHVTPHYWTAAELLLLQLDMLAYTDQSTIEPVIVVGEGIPSDWLTQPMQVEGLSTVGSQVNWTWDGQAMRVQIRGSKASVKLGSGFSPDTPLSVEYL